MLLPLSLVLSLLLCLTQTLQHTAVILAYVVSGISGNGNLVCSLLHTVARLGPLPCLLCIGLYVAIILLWPKEAFWTTFSFSLESFLSVSKIYFFYVKVRIIERRRKRENFCMLIPSPNAHNSQS